MDSSMLAAAIRRLDQLDRQVRRWKVLGSSAAIGLGLVFLLGAYPSKDVEEFRARRFVIVNPSGNPVGEFSAREGVPALKLLDPSGSARVVLSYGYDIPSGLLILDGKHPRADLSFRPDNSVALDLFDKEGKLRATIAVNSDGVAESAFHDKNGKVIRKTP